MKFLSLIERAARRNPGPTEPGQASYLSICGRNFRPFPERRISFLQKGVLQTPLGSLTAISDEKALHFLGFDETFDSIGMGTPSPIQQIQEELDRYFSGEKIHFQTPLYFNGTPFQHRVWNQLRAIGHGKTQSYGEIAKGIDQPKASRAIGGAVGRNPFLIIVPCHRVIRTGGALGGFSAGIERKKWLLSFEEK